MRRANYAICEDSAERMVIRDLGPWDRFPTVTNDAEDVVRDLAPMLRGRRLFYFDSEGQMDELVVEDGRFTGFKPGPNTGTREGS